jgi:hypothetical protein
MVTNLQSRWDLSVNDLNGQLILVVEIKQKLNTSPEWAAKFLRNILAHGTFPKAKYFLLAFPDRFYLWNCDEVSVDISMPTYIIDASELLQPYFKRAEVSPKTISGKGFELIIAFWVGEIMHSESSEEIEKSQPWLIDSGLYAALSNGVVSNEAAA